MADGGCEGIVGKPPHSPFLIRHQPSEISHSLPGSPQSRRDALARLDQIIEDRPAEPDLGRSDDGLERHAVRVERGDLEPSGVGPLEPDGPLELPDEPRVAADADDLLQLSPAAGSVRKSVAFSSDIT